MMFPSEKQASFTDTSYLQDVGEEVVVEHGPVLAADVHDDFAELVPDEVRQSFVVSQQQLGQAAPDLHLVLGWDPQPHLIDQVLEHCQAVHHHIIIPCAGQEV